MQSRNLAAAAAGVRSNTSTVRPGRPGDRANQRCRARYAHLALRPHHAPGRLRASACGARIASPNGRWTAAPQPERGWEPARQVWAPGIHRGARCGVVFVEGKTPVRRPRDQPRLDLLGLDDFPPGSRVPETVRERLRQRYSAWTTDVHPRFDRPRSLNPAFPPGLAPGGGHLLLAVIQPVCR